jgi:hypothetical protein
MNSKIDIKYSWKSVWNFIKDNYGFFLMVTLIILLLYVRYVEVNARKKKISKYSREKYSHCTARNRVNK